jgi:ankyrin repeat protein
MGADGCFLDFREESSDRVRMQDGDTALIRASGGGHSDVVSLLLGRGGQEKGLVKTMLTVQGRVSLVCVKHYAWYML